MTELLDRTSSRELSEWMAYDRLEGLPDRRAELLLAQLLAMTAAIHRDPDASGPGPSPLDYMPWARLDEPEPEPVDLAARIVELNALFGGEDRRS